MTTVADAERYATLPLPAAWKPVLDDLRRADQPVPPPQTHDVTPLFKRVTAFLDDQDVQLLVQHYGHKRSLGEIGASRTLSRQRIQQRKQRALKVLTYHSIQPLRNLITDLCPAKQEQVTVALVAAPGDPTLPGETGDTLWLTLRGLQQELAPGTGDCRPAPGGGWLLSRRRLNFDLPRTALRKQQRFMNTRALAAQTGMSVTALRSAARFDQDVYLTRGGQAALLSWTTARWTTALARELDRHGHTTYHHSELAQALQVILPERFREMTGRAILLILSKAQTTFEHAGRNGHYRLSERGDGHKNNKDAVLTVLRTAKAPLSLEEIQTRLKRDVKPGSLHALLWRDAVFTRFQDRYTITEHVAVTPSPESLFLSALFADRQEDTLQDVTVEQAAHTAGLDPERVADYARTSPTHRYLKGKGVYVLVDSHAARLWRFENWYRNRSVYKNPPPPAVLQAGLDSNHASGRHKRTDAVRAHFKKNGWPFPDLSGSPD